MADVVGPHPNPITPVDDRACGDRAVGDSAEGAQSLTYCWPLVTIHAIPIHNDADPRAFLFLPDVLVELTERPQITAAIVTCPNEIGARGQFDSRELLHEGVHNGAVVGPFDKKSVDLRIDLTRHQRASSSI